MKTSFRCLSLLISSAVLLGASSLSFVHAEEIARTDYNKYAQGLYEISCFSDQNYIWDIRTCTVLENANPVVQLYHPQNVNQQKFYIENYADGCWRISDLRKGEALTASSDNTSISMKTLDHPATSAQTWILTDTGDGSFYIQSSAGNYLTLSSSRAYCGNQIILAPFTGNSAQKWKLNETWLSSEDSADTDHVNPYSEDGPYGNLNLMFNFNDNLESFTSAMLAEHTIETEEHTFELDPEYLSAYVDSLAATYDTQQNPRKFRTTAGQEITLTKGNYGWKLNHDKMVETLKDNLHTNEFKLLDPVWEHKVTVLGRPNDLNDMGDSYIEVDIGTQHVWLYQYGELVMESDCVTGTKNHTDTVQGAFAVFQKRSPATLKGPGYSSYVDFWMPFYNGYGLHNAGWRGSFGGEIYKSNGSHGCVNLPFDAAKTIYNTIRVGYPVIVYSSIPEDANY